MGVGLPETLRLLHKHYGGIDFFNGKSTRLMVRCLERAIKKESEIPNMLFECMKMITGEREIPDFKQISKLMRSREDILKDYGLNHLI